MAASPTVPLKKETVRITLRAKPGTGVPQPRKATAPVAPSAPASKVTARVPAAPGAPTRSTASVPAGVAPVVSPGARTVPLARPATPAVRPAMPGGSGATRALPQATVKLQRTQPLAKPGQASMPIRKVPGTQAIEDGDGRDPEAGLLPLSIAAFVVSLLLLGVVLLGSSMVNDGKYLEIPAMSPPAWQKQSQEGEWIDQFARQQLDANPVPSR